MSGRGALLVVLGPRSAILIPTPCRGLDGFIFAMEEERLHRLRNPGWLGRHWHLLLVWGLAIILGWFVGLSMLVRVAMAAELYDQHVWAKRYHRHDWRARRFCGLVSIMLMSWVVTIYFFWLPIGDWAWQLLWTGVYCLGQWMLSHALHRMVHRYATHGRMSTRGWRKRLYRVALGLIIMAWSIYFAL